MGSTMQDHLSSLRGVAEVMLVVVVRMREVRTRRRRRRRACHSRIGSLSFGLTSCLPSGLMGKIAVE